ncbi:MAG: P-loop NTPase fold protein [Metamycoplasmataceae bacterium]
MDILNKHYKHDIIISEDNIFEECKEFIKNIENDYLNFKNKFNNNFDIFNKQNKNKEIKVFFEPESISKKSPMTIIDAPWGSGKTYFIEELCNYINNGKIKPQYIKNIILIDAWKHSGDNDVPLEILKEIFYSISNKSVKAKIKAGDFFKSALDFLSPGWRNKMTFFDTKSSESFESDDYFEKFLEKDEEKINLVFLDNIERTGEKAWSIIKTIQKIISKSKNFIFVFPMNKNKLNNVGNNIGELSIEKYIDIPFYIFKQNYIGVLKKYLFDEKIILFLNKVFEIEIEEKQLSARELNNVLSTKTLKKAFDKNIFAGIKKLQEIWWEENKIRVIVENKIKEYIEIFFEQMLKIEEIFENKIESFHENNNWSLFKEYFENNISENKLKENFVNLFESKTDYYKRNSSYYYNSYNLNYSNFIKEKRIGFFYLNKIDINWIDYLDKINNFLNDLYKKLLKELKELEIKIKEKNIEKNKLINNNKIIEISIEKLENKKQALLNESIKDEKISTSISDLEIRINTYRKSLETNNEKNQNIEKILNDFENEKTGFIIIENKELELLIEMFKEIQESYKKIIINYLKVKENKIIFEIAKNNSQKNSNNITGIEEFKNIFTKIIISEILDNN